MYRVSVTGARKIGGGSNLDCKPTLNKEPLRKRIMLRLGICTIVMLFVVCLGKLAVVKGADDWTMVKSERVQAGSVEAAAKACSLVCSTHFKCRAFSVLSSLEAGTYDCFLESLQFASVKEKVPRGVFRHEDHRPAIEQYSMNNIEFDIRRLLKGPVAFDGSMIMNHEAHFARNCAYTVSMWVWLFEPSAKHQRGEISILSSRPLTNAQLEDETVDGTVTQKNVPFGKVGSGVKEMEENLNPSIVYNVGEGIQKSRFFFSATRDASGSIHGFWGMESEVAFHEWIHLAIVMTEDGVLKGYQNGRIVGSLVMEDALQSEGQGNSMHGGHKVCPYNFGTKYYHGVRVPIVKALNNTAMQVMGHGGGNSKSTPGMVQDLLIGRNKALNGREIQQLANIRPTVEFPTLSRLMSEYSINGHIGAFSPLPHGREDFYRSMEWGLCPVAVCGEQSLDPVFLLGLPTIDHAYTETDRAHHAVNTGSRAEYRVNGMHRRTQNFHYTPTAGEIDGLRALSLQNGTAYKDVNGDKAEEEAVRARQHGVGQSREATDSDPADVADTDAYTPIVYRIVDFFRQVLFELLNFMSVSSSTLAQNNFGLDQTLSKEEQILRDAELIQQQHVLRRAEEEARNKRRFHEEVVEELYDSAMIWLHGHPRVAQKKHEMSRLKRYHAESDGNAHHDYYNLYNDQVSWRADVYEKSMSALILAMWISNDNQALTPRGQFMHWNYKYASMVAQPIHMALAQREGFDKHEDVKFPRDLGYYLKESLDNFNVMSSFGLKNRSRSREPEDAENQGKLQKMKDRFTSFTLGYELRKPGHVAFVDVGANGKEPILPAEGYKGESVEFNRVKVAEPWKQCKVPIDEAHFYHAKVNPPDIIELEVPDDADTALMDAEQKELVVHERNLASKKHQEGGMQHRINAWYHLFALADSQENTSFLLDTLDDGRRVIHKVLEGMTEVGLDVSMLKHLDENYMILEQFGVDSTKLGKESRYEMNEHAHLLLEVRQMLIKPVYLELPDEEGSEKKIEDYIQDSLGDSLEEPSRFPEHGLGPLGTPRESFTQTSSECEAASAYLFPVMQFVASHYGQIDSGVTAMEDVRILTSDLDWQMGEENEEHQLQEQNAIEGDENSMLFLARRYFWGQAGVRADPDRARYWFEQAAERGNAEGLYNVGVLHSSGQLGYAANQTKAIEYFKNASNPERIDQKPFAMALHAVGAHVRDRDPVEGRSYFMRAAAAGNADGHFSFGTMLVAGQGGPRDIPGAIYHLVLASNVGHVRALNYLTHGLYDPESWLHQYGRESVFTQMEWEAVARAVTDESLGMDELIVTDDAKEAGKELASARERALEKGVKDPYPQYLPDLWQSKEQVVKDKAFRLQILNELVQTWRKQKPIEGTAESTTFHDGYRHSANNKFQITLPHGVVEIPNPLGSGNTCPASLHLMKHLSMMSYRTNDLMDAGLNAYVEGNLLESLEYYNEAADLGVQAALENSMVIYEMLKETECSKSGGSSSSISSNNESESLFDTFLSLGKESDLLNNGNEGESDLLEELAIQLTEKHVCYNYYDKMIMRRRVQLANSGDATAKRLIAADYLAIPNRQEEHVEEAQKLLVYAAEQGDIQSLMDLGWLFYRNDMPFRNTTTSKFFMKYVSEWEKTLTGGSHNLGYSLHSTGGMATSLALAYMHVDDVLADMHLISLEAIVYAWKYVFEGIYNDLVDFIYNNVFPLIGMPSPHMLLEMLYEELEAQGEELGLDVRQELLGINVRHGEEKYPPSLRWLLNSVAKQNAPTQEEGHERDSDMWLPSLHLVFLLTVLAWLVVVQLYHRIRTRNTPPVAAAAAAD